MMKYRNNGSMITFDLTEKYSGYSVECIYLFNREKEKYRLTMRLKCQTVSESARIDCEEIDSQYIPGTRENIKQNIARIVERACETGFFDKYIEQFEYVLKCFDIGNEAFENVRLRDQTA